MGSLSTTNMVADLLVRCRFGVDGNFAIARLNQAYRDMVRNVGFIWELKKATLSVTSAATTADLPADFDPGKPAYLSGPSTLPINIPHKTFDTGFDYQLFYAASSPGIYSAWTFYTNFAAPASGTLAAVNGNATVTFASGQAFADAWVGATIVINSVTYTITGHPTSTTLTISPAFASSTATYAFLTGSIYTYTAALYPAAAAPGGGGFSLPFVYHQVYADQTIGTTTYFPSPSEFDYVLILAAEAETKRIYEIPSWQAAKAKADEALPALIDIYRSSKLVLPGLAEQQRETAESAAKRNEG